MFFRVIPLAPCLLFIKKRWSLIAIQFAILGRGVWISTIVDIANERILMGETWGKMGQ
ncbi:MAG: hypothetical protein AB1306_06780 [Nitrospirota bacterium]